MEPSPQRARVVALSEPTRVKWFKNGLIAPLRRGALFSLAIGVSMLLLASSSLVTGEVTIFTLVLIFLMFYFTDNAMGRFLVAQRAPREVGLWEHGVIVRTPRGQDDIRWVDVVDMEVSSNAGRYSVLRIRLAEGSIKNIAALPASLASEVKVVWLEAVARGGRFTGPAEAKPPAPRTVAPAPPERLQVSRAPSFWTPRPPQPEAPRAPPSGETSDRARPTSAAPGASTGVAPAPAPTAPLVPAPRPQWSFTKIGAGAPTPDPRYVPHPGSVKPFQWHFIPSAGSRTGAWLLLAVVVLASIAVSRIAADLALSLLGVSSDPWAATGLGLAVGLGIALVFFRLARAEMSGEVAGSVIFLPMFDRTKADIADTLREAGVSLQAGQPRLRESRGRLILTWPEAHTRAVVMQASQESRAILLRTVGRGRFDLHSRFKGAILERLRAGSAKGPALQRQR